jgi:hypothetical protein
VVCTHGIPTDEAGKVGKAVTKDFIDSLGEWVLFDWGLFLLAWTESACVTFSPTWILTNE